MTHPLHVSEVFGPTVQGEGPAAGRACVFIRLGGCNLTCAACDTPYTWDGHRFNLRQEITPTPVDQVVNKVAALAPAACPNLVVISGGEPLLHQTKPGLRTLVDELTPVYEVHVETNGTLVPESWMATNPMVRWVVSPKLVGPLATDRVERRVVPHALNWWADATREGRAHFKIVVSGVGDLEQVAAFVDDYRIPHHRVYVMPAGDNTSDVINGGRAVVDDAVRYGFGVSLRAHVLLWPDETRGH